MAAALRDGPRIVPEGAGQIGGDAAEALAQRSAPPDKNVIMTGPALPGSKQAHGFPQAPANAVALHGFPGNTLGYREAEAGRAIIIAAGRCFGCNGDCTGGDGSKGCRYATSICRRRHAFAVSRR